MSSELCDFLETGRHFRWGRVVGARKWTRCRWVPWVRKNGAQFSEPLENYFFERMKCRRNTYIYTCVDRPWCEMQESGVKYEYKWIATAQQRIYSLSRLWTGVRGSTSFHWTQRVEPYMPMYRHVAVDPGVGELISETVTFNGHLNQLFFLGIMTKMNSQKAH
jgi:hypothetical protein